jgi:hypothetical protein
LIYPPELEVKETTDTAIPERKILISGYPKDL